MEKRYRYLVKHLIYGDIEETPLRVLGSDCPSDTEFAAMDAEQRTRLAAAAAVTAWWNCDLKPRRRVGATAASKSIPRALKGRGLDLKPIKAAQKSWRDGRGPDVEPEPGGDE